jgi:hypothetical protein
VHPTHSPDEGLPYLTDPAWGEKLWIMHRDNIRRLLAGTEGKIGQKG